jgi:hypothetical protein
VRWHDEDRARLARLIAARGRVRLARGAATALADLERARGLGAAIADDELRAARLASAIVALRHSDARTREGGRRTLAAVMTNAIWAGARPGATPAQRGQLGAWLWAQGAKRAAWDELSAWRAATPGPRDPALQDAYLVAARWWTPLDQPGPPADELIGVGRCAFGGCAPRDVVGKDALERAYLAAPLPPPVREPADVAALVRITLHQALRGDVSWGPALAARVDLAAFADPVELGKLPASARPVVARLVGRTAAVPADAETPAQRLVLAAARMLDGGPGDLARLVDGAPDATELRQVAAAGAAFTGDARAAAAARHAAMPLDDAASPGPSHAVGDADAERAPGRAAGTGIDAAPEGVLPAIAAAFLREPLVADRLARDAVAGAIDAAAMHATIGALFDGLGDPARARAAWQAAVDASAEPAFLRGLAEAQARQGDPDAALITATAAAAASGDPAVVWTAVARALVGAGKDVHALDAARSAIDLAAPEALAGALDVAIAASRALGRDDQAARLADQRARLIGRAVAREGDPTDAQAALDAHRAQASVATTTRLWIASRWNPRDVALRVALRAATRDDAARQAAITAELVELAGDRDPYVRRAAVAALR